MLASWAVPIWLRHERKMLCKKTINIRTIYGLLFVLHNYYLYTLYYVYNKEDYVPGSAPHEILISTI